MSCECTAATVFRRFETDYPSNTAKSVLFIVGALSYSLSAHLGTPEDVLNLHTKTRYLNTFRKPHFSYFSTNKIDERLGFFQKEFELTGPEVRQVTAIQPRLITYKLQDVKTNMFAIHEEMGFTIEERKAILLKRPQLFMKKQTNLLEIFEYLHRDMKISTETIAQVPGILTCRLIRLQQRHKFLEKLGKAQFNPKEPRYVALLDMASGSDVEFCENVAKCPLESFYTFLKTL